jgi:hypothetical protein
VNGRPAEAERHSYLQRACIIVTRRLTGRKPNGQELGQERSVGRESPAGGMRERTNRTVSKTVVSQGTVGSNPTPSAVQGRFPVGATEVRPGAIPQKSLPSKPLVGRRGAARFLAGHRGRCARCLPGNRGRRSNRLEPHGCAGRSVRRGRGARCRRTSRCPRPAAAGTELSALIALNPHWASLKWLPRAMCSRPL